jgi:ribonuclease HI
MESSDAKRHTVRLYTDGGCIGNPGPGGWAFILKHPATGRSREGSGGEHHATNNRMEITAVIRGLEALKTGCRVELFSDSQYVLNAIDEWIGKWKKFGWRRSPKAKTQVKNVDLWIRLDELLQLHEIKTTWVRGHAGHVENERCDVLARAAADKIARTPAPPRAATVDPVTKGLFVSSPQADEDDEA